MKHVILLAGLLTASMLPAQTPSFAFTAGGAHLDHATGIAVGAQNESIVTGSFMGSNVDFDPGPGTALMQSSTINTNDAAFLATYNSTGQYLWSVALCTADTFGGVHGESVAASNGMIFVAGEYTGVTTDLDPGSGTNPLGFAGGQSDIFIAQYNTSGQYQWAFSIGGSGSEILEGMATDAQGNCYITGSLGIFPADFDPGAGTFLLSATSSGAAFVASYNPYGQLRWAFTTGEYSGGRCITVDASGNVLVGGGFTGSNLDFDPGTGTALMTSSNSGANGDGFIAKYSGAGQYLWAIHLEQSGWGSSGSLVLQLQTDAAGNVYAAGTFSNAQTGVDFDPGANAYMLISSGGGADIFLAGYDASGNFRWAFGLGGNGFDTPDALAANAAGDLVLSAVSYTGLIDVDPGAGTTMIGTASYSFIARYDAAGNFYAASELNGPSNGAASFAGMVLDNSGTLYTCGRLVSATIDFDMGAGFLPLSSLGSSDAFVAIYQLLAGMHGPGEETSFSFFPNPAQNFAWVEFPDEQPRELLIYDAAGKLVLQEQCEENRFGLHLAALSRGMYVLEIKEAGEKTTRQKFVKE